MKFCIKCGEMISDETEVCPACGWFQEYDDVADDDVADDDVADDDKPLKKEKASKKEEDRSSFGWAVVGFLIPIAGLILYLVWKDDTPLKAKSVGRGALTKVIVGTIFIIIYVVRVVSLVNSVFGSLSALSAFGTLAAF